jgi:hypothetical protein
MPLQLGDKLGPYEILSLIGAGGMGEVWKARDTRLDRTVAPFRVARVLAFWRARKQRSSNAPDCITCN